VKPRMRFELEEPGMRPEPLPPPGAPAVPPLGQRLPVQQGQGARLRRMVEDALEAELSPQDMEVVGYLLRRAYGQGLSDGGLR
jgi:hypothetical protein